METKQMSRALMIIPQFTYLNFIPISSESIVNLATHTKGRSNNLGIPAVESNDEVWEKWEGEEKAEIDKRKKS
ncbi:MAG: hypothetical protein PHZ26_00260 [Candidatus Gracilibacteria bacterium]|nr:hypothetical protein [Candidatus Gracilibacteria bacterium]MDD2908169.1 hypothetical protein [Candidatus Gracilibacteria bacterium]